MIKKTAGEKLEPLPRAAKQKPFMKAKRRCKDTNNNQTNINHESK